MTDIAAVIVNYNGLPFVLETVGSLRAQSTPPSEIIVVDNGSTDGSIESLRNEASVRLIESPRNVGFAEGCNIGVRGSRAPYIALLNSDATADHRWLETLAAVLDAHPSIAATMGKIYFAGWMPHIEQAGAYFNNLGNYWGRGFTEADTGQFEREEEVAGLTACAMLLRRDALNGEPLFDPAIFMYGEELDLTLRLRARGYRIMYTPNAVVLHRGSSSVKKAQSRPQLFKQFHSNRNRAKLLMKYYPWRLLLRSALTILMSFVYWDFVFLLRGGPVFFVRAVAAQIRGAFEGWRARGRDLPATAALWVPWMTHHSLTELLAQKRTMESVD
jgi:GT2 family glycosyltransferase